MIRSGNGVLWTSKKLLGSKTVGEWGTLQNKINYLQNKFSFFVKSVDNIWRKWYKKVKASFQCVMKTRKESRNKCPHCPILGAGWGFLVNVLPPGSLHLHVGGNRTVPYDRSGWVLVKRISFAPPGIDTRTVQHVVTRYTGYAIKGYTLTKTAFHILYLVQIF